MMTEVNGASFSADGARVVTASDGQDGADLGRENRPALGEQLSTTAGFTSASFSADGARIVTASTDKTARIWDAKTGQPVGEPLRHEGEVNAASFSADGARIVTASDDKTARIWDAKTGEQVGEPLRHEAGFMRPASARTARASSPRRRTRRRGSGTRKPASGWANRCAMRRG